MELYLGGGRQCDEVEKNKKFLDLLFVGYGLSLFEHLIFGGPKFPPSMKRANNSHDYYKN